MKQHTISVAQTKLKGEFYDKNIFIDSVDIEGEFVGLYMYSWYLSNVLNFNFRH